jgi:hypothetical protein
MAARSAPKHSQSAEENPTEPYQTNGLPKGDPVQTEDVGHQQVPELQHCLPKAGDHDCREEHDHEESSYPMRSHISVLIVVVLFR